MSTMNQETFREIVNLLIPHCTDTQTRQSLVKLALSDCNVTTQLNFSGNAQDFVVHLVSTLLIYGECQEGKPAIVALLEQLKYQVGHNHYEAIDGLITTIPDNIAELVHNAVSITIATPIVKTTIR